MTPEEKRKRQAEAQKRWNAKNRDKVNAIARASRQRHLEKVREADRARYAENAAEKRAKAREYRQQNLEACRLRTRLWSELNRKYGSL